MFDLEEINLLTFVNPKELCDMSEKSYNENVSKAADMIIQNMDKSKVVLISGPSSSGKTTTASKIDLALEEKGVKTEYISMDDYYMDISPENTPRTSDGKYDLESPLCLDSDLLNAHLARLTEGATIDMPHFDFVKQSRSDETTKMHLDSDSVVIVEGIHALNPTYTSANPDAFKLYIATKSDVYFKGIKVFDKTWFRLIRRIVRDAKFRGNSADKTLQLWDNIRRGEQLYIDPYCENVNYTFDTCFKCELPILGRMASELILKDPEIVGRHPIVKELIPATLLFGIIDEKFVANDSLLREFVG